MNGYRFKRQINVAIVFGWAMTLLFSFPHSSIAQPGDKFKQVEPGFWRGAMPHERGLKQLKSMGVRTVVDLMDEDPSDWKKIADSLGMKYVNIPLRRSRPIPQESIKQFLSVVEDQKNRPVYVHCRGGQDRTGAMIAIYRINANNWTADRAIKEMKANGYHPMFKYMSGSVAAFEKEHQQQVGSTHSSDNQPDRPSK